VAELLTVAANPVLPQSPDWQWWLSAAVTLAVVALVVTAAVWFVWLRDHDHDEQDFSDPVEGTLTGPGG
jgi:hypothetical protein